MKLKFGCPRFWKVLGWSLGAALLFVLLLQPLGNTLLPLDNGLAFAQTGAPPPSTPVIDGGGTGKTDGGGGDPGPGLGATPPASIPTAAPGVPVVPPIRAFILPAGLDPVPENVAGALARIPADARPGAISQISLVLSSGSAAAFNVPTDPVTERLVRVVELSADQLPASIPEGIKSEVIFILSFDLFEYYAGSNTVGEVIHQHKQPLTLIIRPPTGIDPVTLVLLHFDPAANQYQVIPGVAYPDGSVQFMLAQTSIFVLSTLAEVGSGQTLIAPPPVIPSGLPRTGDGSRASTFPWPLPLISAGFLIGLVLWRWRASRRQGS
jgi:hypothetical protein